MQTSVLKHKLTTKSFLLECPAFSAYKHRDDPLLAAPPPTDLLPSGHKYTATQHMFETVQVDESSYDGTDELCNKIWLEQMGWGDRKSVV